MFFMYLNEISHPKVDIISNVKVLPKRLEMAWRTVDNKCDCGVFAMRHMETYAGQPISKWKPGFPKEGLAQENMLEKLRSRYASRMLTSEINELREDVLKKAYDYQKVDPKVRAEHALYAMQTVVERMKSV